MEAHKHDHTHSHTPDMTRVGKAFWIGIVLNMAFVLVEFITGFTTNSLALMSDAGHNLSDVISLGLALFAYKISKAKSNAQFTYGYSKSTILVSLFNAIILMIAVGSIGWEATRRFMHPEASEGAAMAVVAGIGIVVNTVSALLFFRDRKKDLNVKGAYLHLAADALVSVGVVITGILISYAGILWLDPLVSIIIMAVVVYGTWGLLRESLNLSLDAVPRDIDVEELRQAALKMKGVVDMHHIHVWAISTTKNALTAHLVVAEDLSPQDITCLKNELRHAYEHLNIQHVTLETEQGHSKVEC